MISIFFNTRKRIGLLTQLLQSICSTTSNIKDIELLITCDLDDNDTISFLKDYKETSELKITLTIGDKPSNLHVSINKMAENANGDFLFVLNDDVVFNTIGWDEIVTEACDPNEVMYLSTMDSSIDKTKHGRYASFPILTKAAYKSLGYFMSERFVGHGGDVHLWRIFDEIDKVKYVPVFLDHVLHSTSEGLESIAQEETATNLIKATFDNFVNCWEEDISNDVNNVKEYINADKGNRVL